MLKGKNTNGTPLTANFSRSEWVSRPAYYKLGKMGYKQELREEIGFNESEPITDVNHTIPT
jgi:hypothetical protein